MVGLKDVAKPFDHVDEERLGHLVSLAEFNVSECIEALSPFHALAFLVRDTVNPVSHGKDYGGSQTRASEHVLVV